MKTRASDLNPDRAETFVEMTKRAQDHSQNNERPANREQPYWWNIEIEEKRKECTETRRTLTRLRKATQINDLNEMQEKHKDQKKELKVLINKSKKTLWRQLCDELDKDIWGQGYKLADSTLYHPSGKEKENNRGAFPDSAGRMGKGTNNSRCKAFFEGGNKTGVGSIKKWKSPRSGWNTY